MTLAASLKRMAEAARAGALGPDGGLLAMAIDAHLRSTMSLDCALKMEWANTCRRQRDVAIRSFALLYPPGTSTWAAASQTATEVRRYEAGAWLRDRNRAEMPPGYSGTPRGLLFAACKSNADAGTMRAMPISPRQLMRIISNAMPLHDNFRRASPIAASNDKAADSSQKPEIENASAETSGLTEWRRRKNRAGRLAR